MICITVQNKEVYRELCENGIYKAKFSRVSDNLLKPYKFMSKQFGWQECPIFLSPVGFYVEMGGAKFNKDSIAIQLDIPDELVKMQRYYDWSDFIYFTEMPGEFKDACNVEKYETVEDWGKTILDIKVNKSCKDPLQVTVKELRKEWVIGTIDYLDKICNNHSDTGGANIMKEISHYNI